MALLDDPARVHQLVQGPALRSFARGAGGGRGGHPRRIDVRAGRDVATEAAVPQPADPRRRMPTTSKHSALSPENEFLAVEIGTSRLKKPEMGSGLSKWTICYITSLVFATSFCSSTTVHKQLKGKECQKGQKVLYPTVP
uniref:Uncharacterized protein n=1 Tax=Steinernema glaseri TaxID=37863 RepID=A0A1I7ZHF8_9BILA